MKKIKDFLFRLRIFFWYILTEPFRDVYNVIIRIIKILESLNKTVTWIYITLLFMIAAMFLGKKFVAGFFLVSLLIFVLVWEWESGNFMHTYRVHVKKRLKKKEEKYKKTNVEEK